MDVAGTTVYLDSCIVIYLVEEHPVYAAPIQQALAAAGNVRLCISPLVELECLVGPYRLADTVLQAEYTHFFAQLVRLTIPDSVYDKAARLRASHGVRTPDALHIATLPNIMAALVCGPTTTGCSKRLTRSPSTWWPGLMDSRQDSADARFYSLAPTV